MLIVKDSIHSGEYVWHVGETKTPAYPTEVIAIVADGDELDYILAMFDNIPRLSIKSTRRVVTWYGDIAKFIWANL